MLAQQENLLENPWDEQGPACGQDAWDVWTVVLFQWCLQSYRPRQLWAPLQASVGDSAVLIYQTMNHFTCYVIQNDLKPAGNVFNSIELISISIGKIIRLFFIDEICNILQLDC